MRGNSGGFILACAALVACAGTASAQIQWRADPARTVNVPASEDIGAAIAALTPAGREAGAVSRVIVQASGPLTQERRTALGKAGVRLLSALGNHAHFAAIDGAILDAKAINRTGALTGVMAINPAWKIDPRLLRAEGGAPLWKPGAVAQDADIPVTVYLFADVAADAAAQQRLAKYATRVSGALQSLPVVTLEMKAGRVAELAADEMVQWVEPAMPPLEPVNSENRALVQANTVQASPYNLNGAGVSVFVFDGGGILASHQDLAGRVTAVDGSAPASHATHCAGTIGGTGAASGGNNRGMAPGVTFLSAAVSTAGGGWLYSNPTDIEADYAAAFTAGADITSNSIGTNTASNGFDCAWEGDYPVVSALLDTIVRGDSAFVTGNQPLRVCWAGGNERGGARCGTQYNTIGPPAAAKNPIICGAVNANDDSMTSFSGWGPTDDGRMKPDLCAPGCQVGGDGGVTSCSAAGNTSYTAMCGTSMATPTTAGCVALMLQDMRVNFPALGDARSSTFKALLAQSAVDRGNAGPDYQFGYGSIRVQNAIDLMRTGNFAERAAVAGDVQLYTVQVPAGAGPLVFTLAWDDAAGTPNVVPSLVNDLDLQIIGPTGTTFFPWTLNPASPATAAVRTVRNSRDNIEQVRIDAPAAGVYQVRVLATGSQSPVQVYSLVGSRAMTFEGGIPVVQVTPLQLAPSPLEPGLSSPVSAIVTVSSDTLVPGSVQVLFHDNPGEPFISIPMTNTVGNTWTATLPAFSCHDAPGYYFRAQGQTVGEVTSPADAPATLYTISMDSYVTMFTDTMETVNGWSVASSPDPVSTGEWERADPQRTDQQPEDDHTAAPGVSCWVTGAAAGASVGANDVDNGETRLLSRTLDLSAMERPRIGYWRWFNNGSAADANDPLIVDISNDNGATWVRLETVGPGGAETDGGWIKKTFTVSDFVPPSSQVRLRFIASDYGTGHVVEAAIDDLFVQQFFCPPDCPADFNGDGFVDFFDLDTFVGAFEAGEPSSDFNGDGFLDFFDVDAFLAAFEAGC